MDYELFKNLSDKFGWKAAPCNEVESEFNEVTFAAIAESKSKTGKRFKNVDSLILELSQ